MYQELFDSGQLKPTRLVADSTIKSPKIRTVSNCITARYNAGIQRRSSIGTVVVEPKIDILMKIPQWHQRGSVYDPNGIIGCLTATDYKTPKMILDGFDVRKLTPKECLRLMGFPDNKIDKVTSWPISDIRPFAVIIRLYIVSLIKRSAIEVVCIEYDFTILVHFNYFFFSEDFTIDCIFQFARNFDLNGAR